MAKWIEFIEDSNPAQKTRRFFLKNKENGFTIGEIKWYGPFRKYSFFPADNTVFEEQCLSDITTMLHNLEMERKNKVKFITKDYLEELNK